MMTEQRDIPRRRIFKAGTIEFGETALPCIVRLISRVDATLQVMSPLWFPERFMLVVASEGLSKPCKLIWRSERRIGVVFDELRACAEGEAEGQSIGAPS